MHIFYAADVNQLAAESEVMDIGEPEKAKKRKKNKTGRLLYLYPKQFFSQLRAICRINIFVSLIVDVHIFYAADVNQVAAESEVMDILEPEKAKKRKKNKTSRLLYLYPKQSFSQLPAIYCINICVS